MASRTNHGVLMAKITQYLEEFKPVAANLFRDQTYVQANYDFFQNFFQREKLEQAEWPYFQSMKPHMHCFNTMAIAGSNALGNPNHPIEHYRSSFLHLKFGDTPQEDRIRDFTKNKDIWQVKLNFHHRTLFINDCGTIRLN